MILKYIRLVIERSRFAAGQYDINLANEADKELTAMQERIDKLEALQTIAEDVNTWLIKNKLGGTAHQRSLAEALYALKGDE